MNKINHSVVDVSGFMHWWGLSIDITTMNVIIIRNGWNIDELLNFASVNDDLRYRLLKKYYCFTVVELNIFIPQLTRPTHYITIGGFSPGFRIRIDLMRIRIRSGSRFFYNCGYGFRIRIPDPDPGFDDLKLKKIYSRKFNFYFIDQKLPFTYP